jgi:hypothetical protein
MCVWYAYECPSSSAHLTQSAIRLSVIKIVPNEEYIFDLLHAFAVVRLYVSRKAGRKQNYFTPGYYSRAKKEFSSQICPIFAYRPPFLRSTYLSPPLLHSWDWIIHFTTIGEGSQYAV